jgi:hypothetical protein
MWILSSLSRADRIRNLVDSYAWGGESQVVLALYEKDPHLHEYLSQKWPFGWITEIVPMLGNGPTYNEIMRRYPDEPCYGFLADDTLLDVPKMLASLEREAGGWNVAYANDQHHGADIPTMPCLGGDLVRAVGYLSPADMTHWGIDVIWGELGKRLDVLRYRPDLTYTHRNPVWGTAPDDRTYALARQRSFGYRDIFRGWQHGGDMKRAIARVAEAKLRKAA